MSIPDETELKTKIISLCNSMGFWGVYFVSADKSYTTKKADDGLIACAKDLYPWADSVILLLYPFAPFIDIDIDTKVYVPAYYIASNESYHKLKALILQLKKLELQCENVFLPAKRVATEAHVGVYGKNDLLITKEFGQQVVLYTLAVSNAFPEVYSCEVQCDSCFECKRACPTGAILQDDTYCFLRDRCIRNYMEKTPYPDWVKNNIETYLGCERCMNACTKNTQKAVPVSRDLLELFAPTAVCTGNSTDKIRELLGKNISKKRIISDAAAICENIKRNSKEQQ